MKQDITNIKGADVIHLIYGSSAKKSMSSEELLEILTRAREKNRRLGITGMLLYKGGNFLQVLEGEESAVRPLFETIKQDPRHHQVELIAQRPIAQRAFAEWEMGFVNMETVDPQSVPGYSQFLSEPLDSERFKEPVFAFMFLQAFKEGMR
jgi:hypothetical protein